MGQTVTWVVPHARGFQVLRYCFC